MEDLVAFFDGEYLPKSKISLDIDNLGFTRGYGAYECFRTYGRKPFRLKDHIQRLKKTCNSLLIEFPNIDLEEVAENLLAQNPGEELIVRIYVTDHTTEKNKSHLVAICNTPAYYDHSHPTYPNSLKTVPDLRDNRCIKSVNYAYSIIEGKKAKREGFDDILYVSEDGLIHELSRSNVFVIKGDIIYTPKKNILPGITKKTIFEIAKSSGYHMVEEELPLSFLEKVDEVFCSATIRGITPIGKIDDRLFISHKKTLELMEAFSNYACGKNSLALSAL